MNLNENQGTSAGEPMKKCAAVLMLGLSWTNLSISKDFSTRNTPPNYSPIQNHFSTTTGVKLEEEDSSRVVLLELRRLTGLTWEQLAELFRVSRRAIHLWASGKPMASENENRLHKLISLIRKIDRGSAALNRALLLTVNKKGQSPFELLADGVFNEASSLLGPENVSLRPKFKTPQHMVDQKRPLPPETLMNAREDISHNTLGKFKAAKVFKFREG